jgi:hypothetical protein
MDNREVLVVDDLTRPLSSINHIRHVPNVGGAGVLLRVKNVLWRLEADDRNWSCLAPISRGGRMRQEEYTYLVMLAADN